MDLEQDLALRAAREAGGTPDNVHQVFLPPYSPESQPAERLWPLINEQIANRSYETIEALGLGPESRALEIGTGCAECFANFSFCVSQYCGVDCLDPETGDATCPDCERAGQCQNGRDGCLGIDTGEREGRP